MKLPAEVAVIGAGAMGAGIARVFADAGASVRLCARRESSLESARRRLGDNADRIRMTTAVDEALEAAELVVETIVEELEPKRELLVRAEELAAPDAILTTNTSSLPLAPLAAGLRRRERFAGLHWLNPPELVELIEVIGAEETSAETAEVLVDWMRQLGKEPVVVRRDVPGFIVNRLQYALLREAYALVDAGVCSFEDVDRTVVHGLGSRWAAIGPFETMDLAGLDVHAAVAANLWPELARGSEPTPTIARVLGTGALGVKNGRGLRGDYDEAAAERLKERRNRVLGGLRALRDA